LLLFFLLSQVTTAFSFEPKDSTEFDFPIDIVYLWVDGSDPNWLSIKNQYLEIGHQQTYVADEACASNRFYDHDELKYSLRSLLKFAPFFNHIYIVTMNQIPKWMIAHPKITIVDHQEIFSTIEDLPTFNSQSIEANIHHIPGLSEHFIYFNDDVLLGQPVTPYDFFTREGKVKVLFEKGLTVSPNPEVQASLYRKAWVNSSAVLNSYFIKERRQRLCHAPFALRKSYIENIERLFPFVFFSNSSHRFRSDKDFNLTNGLFQYVWKYQECLEIGNLTNKMISIYNDEHLPETSKVLTDFLEKPLHTFCIQDCIVGSCTKTCELLKSFFCKLLPDPAPWEKGSE